MTEDDDAYEYKTVEWRDIHYSNMQEQFDKLIADGWEKDGGIFCKAGMFADLFRQPFKRLKKDNAKADTDKS